jgi:DNA-directed RNA polymerase subunit N (RpoN/RPB10)
MKVQVIGDLWERYLKLIDEGTTDGLVGLFGSPIFQ